MSNLQPDNHGPLKSYFKKIVFFWKNFNKFTLAEFSGKLINPEEKRKFSMFLHFGGDEQTFELGSILQDTQYRANNTDDLSMSVTQLVTPFIDYGKPIKFNMGLILKSVAKPLALGISIVLAIALMLFTFTGNFSGFAFTFPILIPTGFLLFVCIRYNSLIEQVSKKIIEYDRMKDSGLQKQPQLKRPLFEWLNGHMDGFNRGKIDNYITEVYTAQKTVDNIELKYIALKYTSVVSSYTDKDGNTRYKYDSYQGVLLPCSGLGQLTISPDKKVKSDLNDWTTVSQDFNQRFNIWCAQEMDASKLLSPATISDIEKFDDILGSLNLVICPDGNICLLFKAEFDSSKHNEHLSLKQPIAFLASLNEDHFSPTLNHCLRFLVKLLAQINVKKIDSLSDFISDLPLTNKESSDFSHIKITGNNKIEHALSLITNLMEEAKKTKN